jgi:hypothetical protein
MTKSETASFLTETISEAKSSIEKTIYGYAKATYGIKTAVVTFETTHANDVKKKRNCPCCNAMGRGIWKIPHYYIQSQRYRI